ncbi:MAG TPA: glycerophosphodiester phosphodiesterase [Acidobacteriota bacterium]|jgi:glycerophosphoryl diester phosphodiesterase|nr:glycerophosphodiester phosphodiesterase [Acidobacteriota bacterium]
MLVLSHRGCHVDVPENTLEAFDQAIAMGVDGIETDVRLSADGLPILFHDRVAPDGRQVATISRDGLSQLVGYSVPTLEEALQRRNEVLWNIEIKTPFASDAVLALLSVSCQSIRCLITSFWHNVVEQFSRLEVQCGIIIAHRPASAQHLLRLLPDDGRTRTIVWSYDALDATLVQQAASQGLSNFVYALETKNEHMRCSQMPFDGVITDHPEFLIKGGRK